MWKWQIFGKRKANKTQRNFGFSDLEKIPLTFLHEIFLKNSFKRFQNFSQTRKTFFKKIQGKILKEGFQDFSKTPSKKKMPFSQKFFSKNPQRFIRKSLQKSPPKVSPFSQYKSPFYRERFRKYFQIKNLFSKKTKE